MAFVVIETEVLKMPSTHRRSGILGGFLGRNALALLCVLLIMSYFATYYWLTRRERAKLEEYEIRGVLYVPLEEAFRTKDLSQHYRRAKFFAPANWLDQLLFDGDGPTNITFEIN